MVVDTQKITLAHSLGSQQAFSDSELLDFVVVKGRSRTVSHQLKDKEELLVWVRDFGASLDLVGSIDKLCGLT